MPLFQCSKCGCFDNTALTNYWMRNIADEGPFRSLPESEWKPPLCSECDPKIGEWHGQWEKATAVGMLQDAAGFLYHDREEARSRNAEGKLIEVTR